MASSSSQPPPDEEGGAAGLRLALVSGDDSGRASYGAVAERTDDEDQPSRRRGSVTSSVSSLPDLTERLKEAGIYGEYYAYRQKYLQWRKGGAQGAKGELTHEELSQRPDPSMFEFWYPSPSIFKWRFTTAYWKGIFFLLGSLLFTFNSFFDYWGGPGGHEMETYPNFIGSIFYSLGCYAGYLQLINISTDKEERAIYLIPDFHDVLSRTNYDSVVGTVAYLLGALVFQVGAATALYVRLSPQHRLIYESWPNAVGSVCFVVGGVCELTHNRIFQAGGSTYEEPVWWVALLDLVGSLNFLAGSLPDLVSPDWAWASKFVALNFGMGAALYIVSSVMMLVMWRANDFGLSLLRQLNFAVEAKGHVSIARGGDPSPHSSPHIGVRLHLPEGAEKPDLSEASGTPRFSLRATAFIIIYCWFAFVAIMNSLCKQQWYIHSDSRHIFRHVLDLATQMFIVLLIVLVLVLHSAVTDVPDEQPFHCALITLRVVLVLGAISQTIMFVAFFVNPHYDE